MPSATCSRTRPPAPWPRPSATCTPEVAPSTPQLAADAWGEPDPLTDRERQVLRLAGDGLANAEIAGQLHLSEGTVRNYLSEAMSKLGASNRVAAARLARDRGWL